MAKIVFTFLALLPSIIKNVEGVLKCGSQYCLDPSHAYCCSWNSNECCYYRVWGMWWFWIIWIILLAAVFGCCFWCRRRNLRRVEYVVISQPQPAMYGTINYPGAQVGNPAVQPMKPPSYMATPPAYSAS